MFCLLRLFNRLAAALLLSMAMTGFAQTIAPPAWPAPASSSTSPPVAAPTQPSAQAQTQAQTQPAAPAGALPHAGNLPNVPRTTFNANLPAVTIREFRSSVPEITARGATDMFMTALVKTRKFRVLERARMNEGIALEKALNQQGVTTGEIGQTRYVGAGFIFEGSVSEASASSERKSMGFNIGGLGASKATTKDSIGIDVRVVDIESGVVLDAIDVRKDILGEEISAGGVTTALSNVLTRGRGNAAGSALAPNDNITSARKGSVDGALRLAIEEAVNELTRRFGAGAVQ